MIKVFTKRWTALILTLMILFCEFSVPLQSSALESDSGSLTEKVKFIEKLGKSILSPESVLEEAVGWALDHLFDKLFGLDSEMDPEEKQYFEEILEQLNKLQTEVDTLQKTVDSDMLGNLLNDFKNLNIKLPKNVWNGMREIDQEKISTDEKKAKRLSALTDDLGAKYGRDLASASCPFDNYVESLANAMLSTYSLSLDGKPQELMLLQVKYEFLRRKHHWENQALDEWYDFYSYFVGLLIQSLTLEKYSLKARLELIPVYNKNRPAGEPELYDGAVKDRLKDVQNWLNQVKAKYFGDENDTAWIPKFHDLETERYYWTPGHEILFEAQVNMQTLPREVDDDIGWFDVEHSGKKFNGFDFHWNKQEERVWFVVWDHWKPFFKPTQTLTESQAKTIYNDYKGSKSFYEIFIGTDEGNFKGLQANSGVDHWKLIIDPEAYSKDHNLNHPNLQIGDDFDANHLFAYFMNAEHKGDYQDPEKYIFARYKRYSNWVYHGNSFIGLRIKMAKFGLGDPEPTLTPKPTPNPKPLPKTGDTGNPVLWLLLIALSTLGIGGMFAVKFRKKG